jgi:thiol:disulfide interchange protein DsbD
MTGSTHPRVLVLFVAVIALTTFNSAGAIELNQFGAQPVTVETFTSLNRVPAGGSINVAVRIALQGHWHVNAHKVNDEYLIPTTVEMEVPDGFSVVGVVYPDGIEKQLGFSDKPMLLYETEALIGVTLEVSPDVQPGETTVTAIVTYQACDNEKCLAPENKRMAVPLRVSLATEAIDATHADIFNKIDFTALTSRGDNASSMGRLGAVIGQRGYFFAFLLVFVWGLALNLTPCVYPIIPITVGYFGGQAGGKTMRTAGLASLYVLGMATMYSALGVVAALTGSILGTALQNPFVISFVALVMVGLAMSMFGLYDIRIPMALSNLAGSSSSKGGPVGAFLMGLTVGIVAAPCIGPFVLALLTFVGESGNPVLGFAMFFTLAIGLGTPFLFLGIASGSISKLPKSGEWMDWVKRLFGVILIAMAVFFLQPLIGYAAYWLLLGAVAIIGGILLGFVLKTRMGSLGFMVFKRFVGIAAPAYGLYLLLAPGHLIATGDRGIVWSSFNQQQLVQARSDGQYVVIDFSADWCLPCKELDHKTFSPPEVIEATNDLMRLKVDLTKSGSPEVSQLREQFDIMGVPTVVFLDKTGKERRDLRVFGFVDKNDFLERIHKLKGGT